MFMQIRFEQLEMQSKHMTSGDSANLPQGTQGNNRTSPLLFQSGESTITSVHLL